MEKISVIFKGVSPLKTNEGKVVKNKATGEDMYAMSLFVKQADADKLETDKAKIANKKFEDGFYHLSVTINSSNSHLLKGFKVGGNIELDANKLTLDATSDGSKHYLNINLSSKEEYQTQQFEKLLAKQEKIDNIVEQAQLVQQAKKQGLSEEGAVTLVSNLNTSILNPNFKVRRSKKSQQEEEETEDVINSFGQ